VLIEAEPSELDRWWSLWWTSDFLELQHGHQPELGLPNCSRYGVSVLLLSIGVANIIVIAVSGLLTVAIGSRAAKSKGTVFDDSPTLFVNQLTRKIV
jgi:hypothetical protein